MILGHDQCSHTYSHKSSLHRRAADAGDLEVDLLNDEGGLVW